MDKMNTKNTSTGFTPPSSKAETVNSVGIGIKLENIPLKNKPKSPYLINMISCSTEFINSLSID